MEGSRDNSPPGILDPRQLRSIVVKSDYPYEKSISQRMVEDIQRAGSSQNYIGPITCNHVQYSSLCLLVVSVVYNEWSLWNWCSAPCGITGVRYRTRGCHSTLFGLVNFNAKCDTGGEEKESCVGACPHTTIAATLYPGTWSSWGQFSLCDKTCGGGIQIRHKTCVSGPCIGDSLESASCNDHPCAATMTQLTTTKATTNTKAMTRWATITSTIKATAAWKEFIMSRSIKNVT
eukprot:XP_011429679.1 PREDICTED: semaphorin-5A [Crassostrea gigas]